MNQSFGVAIVGMAGRFPGARNIVEYWRNSSTRREYAAGLTPAVAPGDRESPAVSAHPDSVRCAASLDRMEYFDAGFFGFNKREAAVMDPQHRHLLEVAWEALEDAGHPPELFAGSIGVFAGAGRHAYFNRLVANPKVVEQMGLFLLRHTGNDKDFLATRISYCLNLTGPSLNIQSDHATSLVTIHMAARSLLNCECDLALAGAADIQLPPEPGDPCTGYGSGAGMVVLRRLEDALADGDRIYASILGSAVASTGGGDSDRAAASLAACISQALTSARTGPREIGFIQPHGDRTGALDCIELAALRQAFGPDPAAWPVVGSVNAAAGHLGAASGVASVIGTALGLEHRELPASLPHTGALHAGVTSLGRGGVVAHVVMAGPPPPAATGKDTRPARLVCLSARSQAALDDAGRRLVRFFRENPAADFADATYTLQVGRRAFSHRRTLACRNAEEAIAALESNDRKAVFTQRAAEAPPKVAFMFSGGGAQYAGMGRELYVSEPVFREYVDQALEIARSHGVSDLRQWLYPDAGREELAAAELQKPGNSILSVFLIQYALAQLWISRGVKPDAMIGHSLGEVTAACLAGVMTLEDAIQLVIARGRLFESLPEGAMLSVPLPEAEIRPMLSGQLCIAVVNARDLCVVSGPLAAVAGLERSLTAGGIDCQRIKISVAAHSSMLDPFLEGFARQAGQIVFRPPAIPYISNLRGSWADPADVARPGYWVRHLRETVRFADGLNALLAGNEDYVLLEVGPGTTMGALAQRWKGGREPVIAASLRHPLDQVSDDRFFLSALGKLWGAGYPIDWPGYYGGEQRRRISLPTYPFEHQRHWIGDGAGRVDDEQSAAASGEPAIQLSKIPSLDRWFSRPTWKLAPAAEPPDQGGQGNWLVIGRDEAAHRDIVQRLRGRGGNVVFAVAGAGYLPAGESEFIVDPCSRACFEPLLTDLAIAKLIPRRVVDLLPLTPSSGSPAGLGPALDRDFFSLLAFIQAWGDADLSLPLHVAVVANGAQSAASTPIRYPEKAAALGACRVIPREFPNVTASFIDVGLEDREWSDAAEGLVNELLAASGDSPVALRRSGRWVQGMETGAPPLAARDDTPGRIKPHGVYLITGGLGGIGLAVAEFLARSAGAKLILAGRSPLPPRQEWERWLETQDAAGRVSAGIRKLLNLERLGATVFYHAADIANPEECRAALAAGVARFGPIDGVIHAAGVIDDDVIQLKTRESAEWVFAPKIAGTLALEDALKRIGPPPDFFVVFSSTSAWLGLPGQVDYAAANAFLDAFAESRDGQGPTRYLSLGWGVWAEVGMAAKAAGAAAGSGAGSPSGHPLLGNLTAKSPGSIVYHARYAVKDLWPLNEHRIAADASANQPEQALIPGTGFLEIARAALTAAGEFKPVEIRNLFLAAPLTVPDSGEVPVRVTLRKQGGGWRLTVASQTGGTWTDHATGEIEEIPSRPPQIVQMDAFRRNCSLRRLEKTRGVKLTRQEHHLAFGPRWDVLERIDLGKDEALGVCQLAPEFGGDLASYRLHPALLDLAIHIGLELLPPDATGGFFAPMSFQRVRVHAPLPSRLISHVLMKPVSGGDVYSFDVALLSASGELVMEIEDFSVKRIARSMLTGGAGERGRELTLLQQWLPHGILPAEGMAALQRLLESGASGAILVSSMDLPSLRASLEPGSAPKNPAPGAAAAKDPPRDEYERAICALFQDLLGIENCGIHDDFFELGGHSLVAVRLFNRIRKMYAVEFGLAVLFQAPTVKKLAALARERLGVSFQDERGLAGDTAPAGGTPSTAPRPGREFVCLVPIQPKGSKPPLFLMPGWNGNVVGFQALSRQLGKDQPLYGLQSYGLDGKHAPFTRMEDVARYFLEEVRAVQPHGPYLLGGMSFGGMVGFEMARQLQEEGEEVALLALLDTLLDRKALGDSSRWKRVRNKVNFVMRRVSFHGSNLIRFSAAERAAFLKRVVKSFKRRMNNRAWQRANKIQEVLDQVQAGVQFELPQAFRNVGEANLVCIKNYNAKAYAGPAVLFRAMDQGLAGPFDTVANWKYLVRGGLTVHPVPGNHLTIIEETNAPELARKLSDEIARAEKAMNETRAAERDRELVAGQATYRLCKCRQTRGRVSEPCARDCEKT